jgi:hypothetical protein
MKKIFLSFTVIAMLCLTARATFIASINSDSINKKYIDKKNEISIGANRTTGEMQLRFTTDKAGKASITVLNDLGEIVLQQTETVTNSLNTIPLKKATELNEGSYTVRLVIHKETYHTRFMIWK